MEKPLSSRHIRSLLLENCQEPAQGLHNVARVDRFAPGYIVCKDEPLIVEQRKDHLLLLVAWTLALIGPGWPFLAHCLDCAFVSGV